MDDNDVAIWFIILAKVLLSCKVLTVRKAVCMRGQGICQKSLYFAFNFAVTNIINNYKLTMMLRSSLVAQSCLTLCDPMTVAHQAPHFMGFSRQEYWSGLPFPSPGDFPDPGIKPRSPALQADSLLTELQGKPKIINI